MEVVVLIICLIVFFFCLYRLGRDDHVLIRRNISMEQLFDVGFLAIIFGLFFSRLLFVFFHRVEEENFFLHFFSSGITDFSLFGIVAGGWIWTYLMGKYKRYPLGRIFDFLSLSLVVVLPFLGFARIASGFTQISAIEAGVYLVLAVVFWKVLYPRLIGAKLREGMLSMFLLFCLLGISVGTRVMQQFFYNIVFVFAPDDFFLLGVCVLSAVLVFRQGRKGKKKEVKALERS